MQITELNRECLLHIFSFLDKEDRKSLSRTCQVLCEAFRDPALWSLLCFSSPSELKKDNFLLSPTLRSLSICWHSSRVKVCNIEDWLKSSFQRDICSRHQNLVNNFLNEISNRCPNLLSVILSGCGHLTDDFIIQILQRCSHLKTLKLENCARLTDKTLEAVTIYGSSLATFHVDFCRNITQEGINLVRRKRHSLSFSAERSAEMIPDQPDKRGDLGQGVKKRFQW
ncbi:F-box and leucine-rich protein 22 [Scyliorhinus canicula]|uniref:F-box and leucine-rich protein 22 n=1 Tax=Scyliorhinus canicula TaxID=7830 RepID=UPI0018F31182|nr:F-box and leucine-rich protein 22 [Scyliorhinus canicula]XP_038640238.1 F-box and leucine-rich protein 22 [Scyliorhinus canicula]